MLWHKQPKKHLEEKCSWPMKRHEAMPSLGWDEEQERGAARQLLTQKVGATPS